MKTIEARITKNIKEDPSIEQCDIWNIQTTFLDGLPDEASASLRILMKSGLISLSQLERTARALPSRYEHNENHA